MSWKKFQQALNQYQIPSNQHDKYLQYGNKYRRYSQDEFKLITPQHFFEHLIDTGIAGAVAKTGFHAAELIVLCFQKVEFTSPSRLQDIPKNDPNFYIPQRLQDFNRDTKRQWENKARSTHDDEKGEQLNSQFQSKSQSKSVLSQDRLHSRYGHKSEMGADKKVISKGIHPTERSGLEIDNAQTIQARPDSRQRLDRQSVSQNHKVELGFEREPKGKIGNNSTDSTEVVNHAREELLRAMSLKRLKMSTKKSYLSWFDRFNHYCMGNYRELEVQNFISYLAREKNVSANTQKQALAGLSFFFRHVLFQTFNLDYYNRSSTQKKIPEVLSKEEVRKLLAQAKGQWFLFFSMLYGCGLRLNEGLNLRYKDVNVSSQKLMIQFSKGNKSRTVTIPNSLLSHIKIQLDFIRTQYQQDCEIDDNRHVVVLPDRMSIRSANLSMSLDWQYFFPNPKLMRHPDSGEMRRFHPHPDTVRKNLNRLAKQAGLNKRIHPHIFRHSFATHCLESGLLIEQLRDILGHSDVKTTMIYLHTSAIHNRYDSPLDDLFT